MTPDRIVVTLSGLVLSALIAWYFWFSKKTSVQARVTVGVQEISVTVKGGYTPDLIVLKAGQPVRLNFTRQETISCSEMVLFPDFGKSAKLPTSQTVPIEFTPQKPGEYGFQCQMGMFRGKLVVT